MGYDASPKLKGFTGILSLGKAFPLFSMPDKNILKIVFEKSKQVFIFLQSTIIFLNGNDSDNKIALEKQFPKHLFLRNKFSLSFRNDQEKILTENVQS